MISVNTKIKISPTIFLLIVAVLFSKDLSFSRASVILSAAFLHEMGHIFAARLLDVRIKCIRLDVFGAMIETDALMCSYQKEAVLCFSGPFANILSAILVSLAPFPFDTRLFAVASVAFAVLNLLPAKGFDGGRALACLLLLKFSPKKTSSFIEITSFICVFLLWTVSVYFIMRTGSYLSLFVFSGALFSKLFLLPDH